MKFVTKKPPIVQSSAKTYKRSISLNIALIVISITAIFTNGRYNLEEGSNFNLEQAFTVFGMLVVAAIAAVIIELFYRLSEGDTTRFSSYKGFIDPINTGLLIALLLPITTPIYVLILAVLVGTYAGKLVFGGFGYYIFNPALVGALFANLSFGKQMFTEAPLFQSITTPLELLQQVFSGGTFSGISVQSLLLGEYLEIAIGGTSFLVLAVLFIYLTLSKVIDLRLSLTFLCTVVFISLGIGTILWAFEDGITVSYILVNLFSGLTMFAAVFLLSDPVSTPTSRETKLIFAVVVAILMMMMRTLSDNTEGVIFAILFGNMITPFINRTVKRSNRSAFIKTVVGLVIAVLIVTVAIGFILQGQLIEANETVAMIGGIL